MFIFLDVALTQASMIQQQKVHSASTINKFPSHCEAPRPASNASCNNFVTSPVALAACFQRSPQQIVQEMHQHHDTPSPAADPKLLPSCAQSSPHLQNSPSYPAANFKQIDNKKSPMPQHSPVCINGTPPQDPGTIEKLEQFVHTQQPTYSGASICLNSSSQHVKQAMQQFKPCSKNLGNLERSASVQPSSQLMSESMDVYSYGPTTSMTPPASIKPQTKSNERKVNRRQNKNTHVNPEPRQRSISSSSVGYQQPPAAYKQHASYPHWFSKQNAIPTANPNRYFNSYGQSADTSQYRYPGYSHAATTYDYQQYTHSALAHQTNHGHTPYTPEAYETYQMPHESYPANYGHSFNEPYYENGHSGQLFSGHRTAPYGYPYHAQHNSSFHSGANLGHHSSANGYSSQYPAR